MSRPRVNITLSNGGLNIQPPSGFGTCAILVAAPIAPVAGYGTAFMVRNKKQVSTAFAQVGNEAVVTAINEGFYSESPEGSKLYILAMAPTTTLATMLAAVNVNKPLNMANGDIRMVGVIKFPSGAYTPDIVDGFDDDVHAAVAAAQTICNFWFGLKKPFRVLIQGYEFTNSTDAKDYSENLTARNVGIVVGSINDSTARATLLALGMASRSQPQQNIGRIKSGSLNIADNASVKIGAITVDQMVNADLDELHTKRYITFDRNQTGSGYVWNDDNMLVIPSDDFNNLRHGRVIDNATRITYATYYTELKDDVDVDENGRMSSANEKALETAIETAIDSQMRSQLSKKKDGTADVISLVNPDPVQYAALYAANDIVNPNFNILQTNQVYIFVRLKPKGCLKYLDVYLGLTS